MEEQRRNVLNKFRFLADLLDESKIPYKLAIQTNELDEYLTILYYPSHEEYVFKVTDLLHGLTPSTGLIVSYKFINDALNFQEESEPMSIFHKIHQDWEIKRLVGEVSKLKLEIAQLRMKETKPVSPSWYPTGDTGPHRQSDNSEK